MTIDEAKAILFDFREQESGILGNEFAEAVQLGIEALKRIKECRLADYMIKEDLLPGETEEEK